jgi:hypothetical protein
MLGVLITYAASLTLFAFGAQAVPLPPVSGGAAATAQRKYAPIRYADSSQSVNDRCPVRGGVLSRNIRPVYVNRRPVGFC